MVWSCYLRKGIVYLPAVAKVKTGGYIAIDPVFVISVEDAVGFSTGLKEVIARGNPVIPEAPHGDYPDPVLLKYAGVKTWEAFVKGAFAWTINDLSAQYKIVGKRKARPRGWEDDPDQTLILPIGATVDDLCSQMVAIVQEKAAVH